MEQEVDILYEKWIHFGHKKNGSIVIWTGEDKDRSIYVLI